MKRIGKLVAGAGVAAVLVSGGFVVSFDAHHHETTTVSAGAGASSATLPPLSSTVIAAVNNQGSGNALSAVSTTTTRIAMATAEATALGSLPAGSGVMGGSLMDFSSTLYPNERLVWAFEVDPAGGIPTAHGPIGDPGTVAPQNYMVAFVDATTGAGLGATAGTSSSLPALPPVLATTGTS